jgi:hypothetical protein
MIQEFNKKDWFFTGIDIFDLTLAHMGEKNVNEYLRISVTGNYFSPRELSRNVFCQLQMGIELNIESFIKQYKEKNKAEKTDDTKENQKNP